MLDWLSNSGLGYRNIAAGFSFALMMAAFAARGAPETRVNVRDFGAQGNGITDDTAAIRQAIATVAPGGGTVYFPCGVYRVSSGLTISASHTTLISDDNCATLKMSGANGFVVLTVRGIGPSRPEQLVGDTTANSFRVANDGLRTLNLAPGSYAIISDREVSSNGPGSPPISTQQVVRIASVEGDTATIEGEFAHHYTLVSPHPSNQGCCPYVQRITPLEDVRILHLVIDGSANSGTATGAVQLDYVVNSEIGFLSVKGISQYPGPTNAFLFDTGYSNSFHDIQCESCGNGSRADGHAMAIRRQTQAKIADINIRSVSTQSTFAFNLASVNFSSVWRVFLDGAKSKGRPFKLLRCNHNTVVEVTAQNSGHLMNGFSITDFSTYNRFVRCRALDNEGTGIMMFGNFNDHNSFEDCDAERNTYSQFGQGKDAFGNYGDDFTTIQGGIFCCDRGNSNLVQINSNDFTMTNASVSDDHGSALNGVVIRGVRSILKGNRFSGLKTGHEVISIPQ